MWEQDYLMYKQIKRLKFEKPLTNSLVSFLREMKMNFN